MTPDRDQNKTLPLRQLLPGALLALCLMVSLSLAHLAVQVKAGTASAIPVTEIAAGVFVHQGKQEVFTPDNEGDVSNFGFIIGDEAVAVIDTGGSRRLGEGLLAAVRARTGLPIRYVINTHMHPDHVFGNSAFGGAGVEFVGHAKLARALAARHEQYLQANAPLLGAAFEGVEIILPTRMVEQRLEIDLGGRSLILEAWPTAHTDNDLTVLDVKTSTLFMGDLLFSGHIPVVDGSLKGWLSVLDELSQRKLERVVPGHGPASMPWPEAVTAQRRYLETVAAEIRQKISEGASLADAAGSVGRGEKDNWLLFDEFNARNVSAAFAELEWE